MIQVGIVLLSFFAYGFLGWVHEVLYGLVLRRKLRNPGFLTGPILPIYGIGAVVIVFLLAPNVPNPFLLFAGSVVVCTVIEYVGHLLLDVILHVRLWDYRDRRLNLQGRVCAEASLGFGILALLLVYVIEPALAALLGLLPDAAAVALAFTLLGLFAADLASAVVGAVRLRPEAEAIAQSFAELQQRFEQRLEERGAAVDEGVRNWRRRRSRIVLEWQARTVRRWRLAFPHAHLAPRREGPPPRPGGRGDGRGRRADRVRGET